MLFLVKVVFRGGWVAGFDLVGIFEGELEAKKPQPQGEVNQLIVDSVHFLNAPERVTTFETGSLSFELYINYRNCFERQSLINMGQGTGFLSSSLEYAHLFVQIIFWQEEVKMAEPVKEEKKPTETPETKGWLYKWTNYIKVLEWKSCTCGVPVVSFVV